MTKVLKILSSPTGSGSKSTPLVNHFAHAWQSKDPTAEVVTRDLGDNPPPHIDGTMIDSYFTPADDRNAGQEAAIKLSDELLDEVLDADVIIIAAPMYNFSVTSSLKTWIDHIARVGRAFRYTENGPEGLVNGKKVYVVTTSGGTYAEGTALHALDHQTPYLKTVLGFMGMDDVTFVHAWGVAGGDAGIQAAEAEIEEIVRVRFPGIAA